MGNANLILLIGFIGVTCGCRNELDVIAPQEPIPVVYCRLNPSDSLIYVTLTRTFSGIGSGFAQARDPQKVFYENADISLESWLGEYKVDEIRFLPADRTKNPGLFPEVPGYCFMAYNKLVTINSQDINGFENNLRLIVDFKGKLGPANATVPMIPLPVSELEQMWDKEFNLYPTDSTHYKVEFPINYKYIKHCELLCRFRYQELSNTWTDHSVTFTLRKDMKIYRDLSGKYYATTLIYPDQFFNNLTTSIRPLNDTILRRFSSMDLIFIAGDPWYKGYSETYINTGNLDAPPSGNINNGYGLFTMVRSVENRNMKATLKTLDSLADGQYTKRLGFIKW